MRRFGERAMTIDEVPLERCLRPAVKLDFRHFPDGYLAVAGVPRVEVAARDQDELLGVQGLLVDVAGRSSGATIMSSGVGAISGAHRPRRW